MMIQDLKVGTRRNLGVFQLFWSKFPSSSQQQLTFGRGIVLLFWQSPDTRLLRLAVPSPPGPPGFLLPNRTIQCYWGSETGGLETGMEKASWVQILNRDRDGDDAKLLPHRKKTHLCGFVHSSERRWVLKALCCHAYIAELGTHLFVCCAPNVSCTLLQHEPINAQHIKHEAFPLWLMSPLMKQQQTRWGWRGGKGV